MPSKLDCPELELRHTASSEARINPPYPDEITSIDLLEIYDRDIGSIQEGGAKYEKSLDHEGLVHHLESSEKIPLLRILFIHGRLATFTRVRGRPKPETISAIGPTTAKYLIERLGVSPAFMAVLTYKTGILKTGNCYRLKRTRSDSELGEGHSNIIEGWYRYSCGLRGLPSHVWFSYATKGATYLVSNCEHNGVQSAIMRCVDEGMGSSLLRPLAFDGFVVDTVSEEWGQEVLKPRGVLVEYEHLDRTTMMKETMETIRELHIVSYNLLIIKEDMVDHIERLRYLLDVRKGLEETFGQNVEAGVDVSHTLSFLLSETQIRSRWVQSYADRIGIQINLFYNLSAQRDNKTNLRIADFTSKIATETQRDSSSMITMAAVTMLFLPGTFVSAVFSMVFFETSPSGRGSIIGLSLVKGWWLFPAITIPLTMLVFAIWNTWRVRRSNLQARELRHLNTAPSTQLLPARPRMEDFDSLTYYPAPPPRPIMMTPYTHLNGGQCEKTWVSTVPGLSPIPIQPPYRDVHPASCGCSIGSDCSPCARSSHRRRSRTPPRTRTRQRSKGSRSRSGSGSRPRSQRFETASPSLPAPDPLRPEQIEENRRYLHIVQPACLVSDLPSSSAEGYQRGGLLLKEYHSWRGGLPPLPQQLSSVVAPRPFSRDDLAPSSSATEVPGDLKPTPRPFTRRLLGRSGESR